MNPEYQEIIHKYCDEQYSISKLLKEYPNYNRYQITRILTDNKITIRGGRKKKTLTSDQIDHIKIMIENGALLKEIAEYCGLSTKTTKDRLYEAGLAVTNKKQSK